tara:strand:- start:8623 stop:9807 length:1185 start_codon:yes stop_codon:yes gene_type:complete
MSPILSILIPTKDREFYLMDIITYILTWKSEQFELIIQDNSENDNLAKEIEPLLNDSRLKYFHTTSWLSVIDNFELAINNSSGKVITMIGDDDGILEQTVLVAKWMLKNDIEAVLPKRGEYTWPDLIGSFNSDYYNSKLRIEKVFTCEPKRVDVKEELSKVLKAGGCTLAELPRLYYGLITKDTLDKVKSAAGRYFPGPSPDMANAASAAIAVDKFIKLDFPLFISGSCTNSGSGMGVQRRHEGEIDKLPHLPKNCKQDWECTLPLFWSGPTVWAESLIKALKGMNSLNELTEFNYSYLFARCLVFNFNRKKDIFEAMQNSRLSKYHPKVWYYYLVIWWLRVETLFPKLLSKVLRKDDPSQLVIADKDKISDAMHSLSTYLKTNKIELFFKNEH